MTSSRRHFTLSAIAGIALAAAQAPLSVWPLVIVGLALSVLLVKQSASPRQAAWTGWIIGTSYFGLSLLWIVEPFFVDAARHGWMAPFALLGMAGGLAIFWALAFWGTARLKNPFLILVLWPLAEYARSTILTGFPWGLLAYSWLDTPLSQTAAWFGPHGLGAISLACAALPVLWRPRAGTFVALGTLAALSFAGFTRLQSAPALAADAAIIRLTQPNAPQHLKWDPAYIPMFFQRQMAATRAEPKPDLIVWPETSLPNWLNNAEETLAAIAQAADGTPVVLGAQRYVLQDVYNSLAVMDGDGDITQVYDKHHLVPFGEYVPLAPLLGKLGVDTLTNSLGGFAAGDGPALLDLGDLGQALPLICYEAVFPDEISAPGGRPDFLLHITNDAWFGTFSGPYQHLAQARFRAIEQGLPLLRSANTGISASIDSRGRILHSLPLGTAGYVDTPLPKPDSETFYAQFGDIPALLALVFLLCALLLPWRRIIH